MTKQLPKYGISLEQNRIAWFKRGRGGAWNIIDSFDVKGLNEIEIRQAFIPKAAEWIKTAQEVAIWLPEEIVEQVSSDVQLTDDDILSQSESFKIDDEHLFIVLTDQTKTYQYYIIEQEHTDLAIDFTQSKGFKAVLVGFSESGKDTVQPILFEQANFTAQKSASNVHTPEQMNLALDQNNSSQSADSTTDVSIFQNTNRITRNAYLIIASSLIALGTAAVFLYYNGYFEKAYSNESEQVEAETFEIPKTELVTTENADTPTQSSTSSTASDEEQIPASDDERALADAESGIDGEDDLALSGDVPTESNASNTAMPPPFTIVSRPENHGEYIQKLLETGTDIELKDAPPILLSSTDLPTTSQSVSSTVEGMALLGIMGKSSDLNVLLQSKSGDVMRLSRGDEIDGWKIIGISKDEVVLSNGTTQASLRVLGS